MKKIIHAVLLTACCTMLQAANVTSIIPAPVKAEISDGQYHLTLSTRILADKEFADEAELLAARLRKATGFNVKVKLGKAQLFPDDILLTAKDANTTLGPEGYELTVQTNGVIIRASTTTGIFYGGESLMQLLPPDIFSTNVLKMADWTAPCVKVEDQPRFGWRGFMLDVSRHFFTKAEVEQALDLMALYKLNTFHWHLVDDHGWRIEINKYPKLTSVGAWRDGIGYGLDPNASTAYDKDGHYGGFYTQQDIRDIVAYATARHITIVPEIEMPGHSSAALRAYPQYLCPSATQNGRWRHVNNVYCAGNDECFTFIDNILAEVAPLFPGKYIHIGGDEVEKVNWQHCPLCQQRMKTEKLKDERELQAYFIRRVEKLVDNHGKSLIGWSEIREGGLAKSAALMDWIGGGAESAASGHDVVMSPSKFCYLDHYQSTNHATEPRAIGSYLPLQTIYSFEPIPEKLAPESQSHVLGAQANLWTEYVPNFRHVEYMMFPRIPALSEVDWSPKDTRDWDNFQKRTALNEKRLDAMGVNYRPLSKPTHYE